MACAPWQSQLLNSTHTQEHTAAHFASRLQAVANHAGSHNLTQESSQKRKQCQLLMAVGSQALVSNSGLRSPLCDTADCGSLGPVELLQEHQQLANVSHTQLPHLVTDRHEPYQEATAAALPSM